MEELKVQNEELKERLKKNETIIYDLQERLRFFYIENKALEILKNISSKVEVSGGIPPKRNGIIESSVLEIVNAMAQVSFESL